MHSWICLGCSGNAVFVWVWQVQHKEWYIILALVTSGLQSRRYLGCQCVVSISTLSPSHQSLYDTSVLSLVHDKGFVVLRKGKLLPESMSNLEQVFLTFWICLHLYLLLNSFPVPVSEKHPYSTMLAPPCFTIGMILASWCAAPGLPNIALFFFNLIRAKINVSHDLWIL